MKTRVNWRRCKVGDVGRVVTGRTPSSNEEGAFGNEYPFITPSDMDGRRKIDATERFLSEKGAGLIASSQVPAGSVAVSCIGWQMGKAVLTTRVSFTNQQLNTIIPRDCVVPEFLYYVMSTRQAELKNLGSGGARTPILNKSRFEDLPLELPPLSVQLGIAEMLSAYDDLIENNIKRIKILEELARSLYREWFVSLRFPGSEKVALVASRLSDIPENWKLESFRSCGDYINGYAFKPDDWSTSGRPIVKIKELKAGVSGQTPRYVNDLPAKYEVRPGDLLFSWSADLDAYLWSGPVSWLNQHIFLVRPRADIPLSFFFLLLKQRMGDFRSLANGATMKHIKREALDQIYVALPPAALLNKFDEIAGPLLKQAEVLATTNNALRQARDLLLPRLISGEIDVSSLPLPAAPNS